MSRRSFSPTRPSPTLLGLALAALTVAGLAPLAVMFVRLGLDPAQARGLLDERTLGLLGRTCLLGCGAMSLALLLGLPFGYLVARTDVPGSGVLRTLGVVPLLLPPLILAMTWTVLVRLGGPAMTVALMGLGTFPLVALFAAKAAERIDARREEAALLAGGLGAVLRMELPLILPPALCGACLAFVFAINDFAVPDYVTAIGRPFNVYADEVFASWQIEQRDARSVATALPLIALTLISLLPALALRRKGAMATVDTDFRRPAPLSLGPWRWPAFGFCAALVTVGALVPIGRLFYEAGGGMAGRASAGVGRVVVETAGEVAGWQLDKLRAAFARAVELYRDKLTASLGFALAAATIATPLALVLGHAIERARRGTLLQLLVVLPIAVPAILFGIGNIVLWSPMAGFYASGGLVVVMLVGRFLAFPTLVCSGAVASLDPQLEEAAELAGARPATRLARVVAPCLWSSLLGGWTLVFVLSMRELDATILVPAANQTAMYSMFNAVHFGRDDFVAALALLIVFLIMLPGLLWVLLGGRRMEVLP